MNGHLYSPALDALDQFKRDARDRAPAPVDFSERVMESIRLDAADLPAPPGIVRKRKWKITVIACIVLTVALLSGFTYQASKNFLSVTDKSGREALRVHNDTYYTPTPVTEESKAYSKIADRIVDTVRNRLLPGEAAEIIIGQKDIDLLRNYEAPKTSSYWAERGFTYTSIARLAPHLPDSLSSLKTLSDKVNGARLEKAELWADFQPPAFYQPDQWADGVDEESGTPYVYDMVGRRDYEDWVGNINFTYKKGGNTYIVGVISQPRAFAEIIDSYPSAVKVHELAGRPVYNDNGALTWSEPTDVGGLIFQFWILDENHNVITKSSKEQLAFAKAIIEATGSSGK